MSQQETPIAVSVMCITYNHAPYLRECLDSLLNQKTDFPYEIVVHDDASADGTTDILKEYASKYPDKIIPIYEKENQYSKNPHFFIKKMLPFLKGKYTAFCEGDDYWTDPNKLQIQYEYMEKHPGCSLCFHNANMLSMANSKMTRIDNHNIYGKYKKDDNNYSAGELHLCIIGPYKAILPSASEFFRTKHLECLPEWFYIPPCTDMPLELWTSHQGYAHYIPKAMSVYRRDTGTSVTDGWIQKPEEEEIRMNKFITFINEFNQYTNYIYYPKLKWLFAKYQNNIDIINRRPLPILRDPFRRSIYKKAERDPLYIKLLFKSYFHKTYYNLKRILKKGTRGK